METITGILFEIIRANPHAYAHIVGRVFTQPETDRLQTLKNALHDELFWRSSSNDTAVKKDTVNRLFLETLIRNETVSLKELLFLINYNITEGAKAVE